MIASQMFTDVCFQVFVNTCNYLNSLVMNSIRRESHFDTKKQKKNKIWKIEVLSRIAALDFGCNLAYGIAFNCSAR